MAAGRAAGRALSFSQLVVGDLENEQAELQGSEAHHLLKSLRAKPGDTVVATDGCGTRAWLRVVRIERSRVELVVEERLRVQRPERRWWLATRAEGARFDWLIEKAVELGAWAVVPLAEGAKGGGLRLERLRRVARAALGQCMAAWGLEVSPARELEDLLRGPGPGTTWSAVVWADRAGEAAGQVAAADLPEGDLLLVVGPPEGLSRESVEELRSRPEVRCISLGERRLRAETAALAALVWAGWPTGRGDSAGGPA